MNNRFLSTAIAVAAGLGVVLLFFVFGNPFAAVEQGFNTNATSGTTGQLVMQDEIVGEGAEAVIGSTVSVHYTGSLENGTVFDTSVGGQPYRFVLGGGQVIPGWDQGLQGMREGGTRLLIIPPELAYGVQGYGPIPPNATLIFQVEMVDVAE